MTQLVLLRALVAASTLRQVLEQQMPVSRLQLSQAMAQLILECEELIEDRECLIPLAFVRHRVDSFLREEVRTETAEVLLPFARHTLLRLIARLWTRLDIERAAYRGHSSQAVKC